MQRREAACMAQLTTLISTVTCIEWCPSTRGELKKQAYYSCCCVPLFHALYRDIVGVDNVCTMTSAWVLQSGVSDGTAIFCTQLPNIFKANWTWLTVIQTPLSLVCPFLPIVSAMQSAPPVIVCSPPFASADLHLSQLQDASSANTEHMYLHGIANCRTINL